MHADYHPPSNQAATKLEMMCQEILSRLVSQQEQLDRLERFFSASLVKESYTTEEAAEKLGRAEWTVRQWCNKGQVKGAKKVRGKGRTGEWRIPHDELVRLQNEGALSVGSCPAV